MPIIGILIHLEMALIIVPTIIVTTAIVDMTPQAALALPYILLNVAYQSSIDFNNLPACTSQSLG